MHQLKRIILLLGLLVTSLCYGITKTEFQRAVLNGNIEDVKEGLKENSHTYVKLRDKSQNTPLHLAASAKKGGDKAEIISLLLRYGAEVNAINEHYSSPLHLAVATCNLKGVERLLKDPSILVNTRSSANMTPLHYAVAMRSCEMIRLLLSHPEMNPNEGDSDTLTPLHFAAKWGYLEEVKELLADTRTDPDPCQLYGDFIGATPLHYAAMQAHPEVVKLFLSHKGVEMNARIEGGLYGGFTPVHFAVMNPHTPSVFETLKALSQAGAQFNLKSHQGKRAKDLTTVRVILEFLKDPNPSYQLKKAKTSR